MVFCFTLKCTFHESQHRSFSTFTKQQQTHFDCLVLKEWLQIPPNIPNRLLETWIQFPVSFWDTAHSIGNSFALTVAKRSCLAEWAGKCWDVTLLLSDSLVLPGETGWITYKIWQAVSQQYATAEGEYGKDWITMWGNTADCFSASVPHVKRSLECNYCTYQ